MQNETVSNHSSSQNESEQKRQTLVNRIVSIAALVLIVFPVGMACIVLGYGMGDNPCILCWEERIIMVLAALIALFIIRYGMKPRYIGALIFTSLYGLWAGYRHSSGHILRDLGQGFGPAIFGLHTYVWVMVIFFCILLFGAILLICQGDKLPEKKDINMWSPLNKFTVIVFQIIILFNMVQAFTQVGPFPFIGQGDPYRMTFNPSKIKWSMEHWPSPSTFSFHKNFNVHRLDFNHAAANPAPVMKAENTLKAANIITLPADINGAVTGITYSPGLHIFAAVTNKNWVYFLDAKLEKILSAVNIDGAFSAEVSNLADVAFDGEDTILVTTDHKTYVRLKYDPAAKFEDSFYQFREGTAGVSESQRGFFSTMRGKFNMVGSLAWDPSSREYVMVTVPTSVHNNFVVIRLSGDDYQLSSEANIATPSGVHPSVTGVALTPEYAYLLAQSAGQILEMDKNTKRVTRALDLVDVANPQGLAIAGEQLLVVDTDGKTSKVHVFSAAALAH